MSRGRLFATIGRQRSGKSTFAEEWVRQWNPAYPRVIVSGDAIRLATHGSRYNRLAEDNVFSTLHVMTRALLISGFDVLIDETNSSYLSLRRILEIDPLTTFYEINTSEEICIQRAIDSNQLDVIPAIKRVSDNLKKIEQAGGLNIFANKILEEIKKRHEYN